MAKKFALMDEKQENFLKNLEESWLRQFLFLKQKKISPS